MEVFKQSLFSCIPNYDEAVSSLGLAVIRASDNFTTSTQPMVVGEELVYGITSYRSTELILVHEYDDYPFHENTDEISENLPKGLRMAIALESKIHLENVRKYRLENIDAYTSRYAPPPPYKFYKRQQQAKTLSNTFMGRIWLHLLNIFNPI